MRVHVRKIGAARASLTDDGFIVLLSVLVTSAVGVVLATALVLLGLASSMSGLALAQSAEARQVAMGCADEALGRIKAYSAFTGSGSLSFSQGNCTFTVTDLGGTNREVDATGTANSATRRTKVLLDQVAPALHVSSWKEVAAF
ncbi:MAG: hypothetical protein RL272_499 [Candidatus Parcubacteria bacterium]|jgi:hypothetical protein